VNNKALSSVMLHSQECCKDVTKTFWRTFVYLVCVGLNDPFSTPFSSYFNPNLGQIGTNPNVSLKM